MSVPLVFRAALPILCILSALSGLSQELPVIPPSHDPTFWGRRNEPYTLKLTVTSTSAKRNGVPHPHVMTTNVFRDSTGRVREEAFYDNGRPMTVGIRDPGENTFTLMNVAEKSVDVLPTVRPAIPLPGKGWTVARLSSRVIDGFPAEGFRFTRSIPAPADGAGKPDTMVEEEWISNALGVVLEQRIESQRFGVTTKTVSHLAQVEPDPTLFAIPSDYSVRQTGSSLPRP